jgi:hypothetical protein
MSGTGTQLAAQVPDASLPGNRTLLAHLLHALNQPLTGLQCSMEIALSGRRQPEQYISTLREGLELTARMRILVAAMREVDDFPQDGDILKNCHRFLLDGLLRETATELHPVAEARTIQLLTASHPALILLADRRLLAALLFRLLESALSLAREGTELRVAATQEAGRAVLAVSWTDGPRPEHSPFSRPELGLLIAQAGWQRSGAEWERRSTSEGQICTVRLPLASPEELSGSGLMAGLSNPSRSNSSRSNPSLPSGLENLK